MSKGFTLESNGLLNVLQTVIGVSSPFDPKAVPSIPPVIKQFSGIWDTGANGTVITDRVVQDLSLIPTGKLISHGVHGAIEVSTYMVSIYLPNQVAISYVPVTSCKSLNGGDDILIGMDIITLGDMVVSNYQGKTVFSFRMPSMARIDFTSNPMGPANLAQPTEPPAWMNRNQKREWRRTHGIK